jgi:erythromycin esterase-like protein
VGDKLRREIAVLLSGPILTNTCSRPYSRVPDIEQEVHITGFDALSRSLSREEVNIGLVTVSGRIIAKVRAKRVDFVGLCS